MENELLYDGIENRTNCFCSFLYVFIFLSFQGKFVSMFTQELREWESPNMIYILKMSDYIMVLRHRPIALIVLFLSTFFPNLHVNIEILYLRFLRNYLS